MQSLELYIYINGMLLHIDDMLGIMQILLVSSLLLNCTYSEHAGERSHLKWLQGVQARSHCLISFVSICN